MMYARMTTKKTATLGTMLGLIFGAIVLTFVAAKQLPQAYSDKDSISNLASTKISSLFYKLDFGSRSNGGLLAAAMGAFGGRSAEATRSGIAKDVPVLLYHGITNTVDRFSVTPVTFKEQMYALKEAGYETITMAEFEDFLNSKTELPSKSFLLTFDDGRLDSYTGADPILEALDYTAVMFISSHDSIRPEIKYHNYYLRIPILERMVASGRWELGSHAVQQPLGPGGKITIDADGTLDNFLSNKRWLVEESRLETDAEYKARIEYDLTTSKKEIEKTFNVEITSISYPFGDYGQLTVNNPGAEDVIIPIIAANYKLAFEQVGPDYPLSASNYPGDDLLHLRRVEVPAGWSGSQLLALLGAASSKTLPYVDGLTTGAPWKHNWGHVELSDGTLSLGAIPSTTGAFAFLDGAQDWTDYLYDVTVDSKKTGHVSLIARYRNEGNFISCAFRPERVAIIERKNGVYTTLATVANPVVPPDGDVSLGISVQGSEVECYEGSRMALRFEGIDPYLSQGGIGAQVWNQDPGLANAFISRVSVVDQDEATDRLKSLPRYALVPVPTKPVTPVDSTDTSDTPSPSTPYEPEPVPILDPSDIRAWKADPGTVTFAGSTLTAEAGVGQRGVFVYMPDGYGLDDYSFSADITSAFGSKVAVVGRYADSKNYVACEYQDRGETILLVEVRNGKRHLASLENIGKRQSERDVRGPYGSVGMNVTGTKFSCQKDGKTVIESEIPAAPGVGTIGMRILSSQPNFAKLVAGSMTLQTSQ